MAKDLEGASIRARVGGSGFTVFTWDNSPIILAQEVSHKSPTPVGQGTVPIHPIDEPYPVELITPLAANMGELTLNLYEVYGEQIWERLANYLNKRQYPVPGTESSSPNAGSGHGPVDIVGIFNAIANSPKPVKIVKYIKPPHIRGKTMKPYTEEYHNCVISSVTDGETIQVGTMEIVKQIVVNYTFMTRGNANPMKENRSKGLGKENDSSSFTFK
jgi:hypothetical protein